MRKSKIVFIIITVSGFLACTLSSDIANIVLTFLLAGVIPGTSFALPFWTMMLIYGTLIISIGVLFVDTTKVPLQTAKPNASKKSQMPRRRYSHI